MSARRIILHAVAASAASLLPSEADAARFLVDASGAALAAPPSAAVLADAGGAWDGLALPFVATVLLVAMAVASWAVSRACAAREDRGEASKDGLDPVEAAYLADGERRAARTVALGLMVHLDGGRATNTPDVTVRFGPQRSGAPELPACLVPYRACSEFGPMPFQRLLATVSAMLPAVAARLRDGGLLRTDARYWAVVGLQAACMLPPLALSLYGLVTLQGGAAGWSLGILSASFVHLVVATTCTDPCTAPGRKIIDLYKGQHAREAVSPLPGELLVGYALGGTDALKGTTRDGYGDATWTPRSSS